MYERASHCVITRQSQSGNRCASIRIGIVLLLFLFLFFLFILLLFVLVASRFRSVFFLLLSPFFFFFRIGGFVGIVGRIADFFLLLFLFLLLFDRRSWPFSGELRIESEFQKAMTSQINRVCKIISGNFINTFVILVRICIWFYYRRKLTKVRRLQ